MKKLVYSIDKVVEHLFMGNSYRDLTISGRILKNYSMILEQELIDKIKELEENVE